MTIGVLEEEGKEVPVGFMRGKLAPSKCLKAVDEDGSEELLEGLEGYFFVRLDMTRLEIKDSDVGRVGEFHWNDEGGTRVTGEIASLPLCFLLKGFLFCEPLKAAFLNE